MANLNSLKQKVLKESSEISDRLKALYSDYELLYTESHRELVSSREAALGSMEGLEVFYVAVQTVKRNRDLIISLMKGLRSLRPLDNFQFIEENEEEAVETKEGLKIENLKID